MDALEYEAAIERLEAQTESLKQELAGTREDLHDHKVVGQAFVDEINVFKARAETLKAERDKLKTDQDDWRKAVGLIASAAKIDTLCGAAIARRVLEIGAERDKLLGELEEEQGQIDQHTRTARILRERAASATHDQDRFQSENTGLMELLERLLHKHSPLLGVGEPCDCSTCQEVRQVLMGREGNKLVCPKCGCTSWGGGTDDRPRPWCNNCGADQPGWSG